MLSNPQQFSQFIFTERQQYPLWLPVLLGTGIAIYFSLSFEPWPFLGLIIVSFFMFSWLLSRRIWSKLLFTSLLAIGLGFAVAQFSTLNVPIQLLQKRTPFINLNATIASITETKFGLRLILDDVTAPATYVNDIPNRVRLSVRQKSSSASPLPKPGQVISIRAVLRPPPAPHLPGSYDFQRRAFFAGIGAYGFGIGEITIIERSKSNIPTRIAQFIHQLRAEIAARARSMATGPPGAVAAALLTGHRGTIPTDTLGHMRDAGIAHLLAISGLHIGLAAGTVFTFLRLLIVLIPRIGHRLDAKKTASLGAIFIAFSYAVLAGFTVPTERAFIMTGIMLLGVLIDRRGITLRSVAWAAGVILLFAPSSLLEPGFQMSFAAVICLVSGYEWISQKSQSFCGINSRLWRYLTGVMLTSVIAGAATAPFAIYHFQHVAAFGLIANMIAVPLAAFWVIPTGLIALVLYPFGLDAWPMIFMSYGISMILQTAETVANLPGAAFDIPPFPPWALGGITLGGLWLCIWKSPIRLLGVVPVIFGMLAGYSMTHSPSIIIDGGGRLVAIQDSGNQMAVSTTKGSHFKIDSWRRQIGENTGVAAWDTSGRATSAQLRCDIHGCQYQNSAQTISISFDESGLIEDCNKSDIIVALVPIRISCHGVSKKVDWFDLWRNGTHAIYFKSNQSHVLSVNEVRGERPWVVRPKPSKYTFNNFDKAPLTPLGPLLDLVQKYVSQSPYWQVLRQWSHRDDAVASTSPRHHQPTPQQ